MAIGAWLGLIVGDPVDSKGKGSVHEVTLVTRELGQFLFLCDSVVVIYYFFAGSVRRMLIGCAVLLEI